MALVPVPLYAASKAAISSFTRSLAPLEQVFNIRVNAVAPAIVQTPIWTPDKLLMVDREKDSWIKPQRIAEMMLELVEKEEYVGGTVLEVGLERNRLVERLNDPGPPAEEKGHTVSKIMDVVQNTFALIESQFGK
jgi:NAD(P)-dependent dehydrogenase (short-subunit alcohol dehydrogenase family)